MAQITTEPAASLILAKPLKMEFITGVNKKALVKSIPIHATILNKNDIGGIVIASGFHNSADLNK